MKRRAKSTQWTSRWTSIGSWAGALSLLVGGVLLVNAALWTHPLGWKGRWILVGTVTLGFTVAFFAGRLSSPWWLEVRDSEESRLAELRANDQYTALRTRLQPHFLFNTLHTISALIHIDKDRAESMVLALSDVLRATISEQKDEVTLGTELEVLRKYLEIEWTRFLDRLELDISVDPRVVSCLVPPFLLQPLVEYAVRTGVERRTEPSLIQLILKVNGESLRVEVRHDYHVGRSRHARKSAVSLEDLENRLRVMYGSAASMRVQKEDEGRQSIVLDLPNRMEPQGEMNAPISRRR